MAKRRMINKVRTDTLECRIAHYRAMGQLCEAWAIQVLAEQIGAPIDLNEIEKQVKMRQQVYQELSEASI